MRIFKDKVMAGAIIGFMADGVKLSVNYVLYKLDLSTVVFWQIVATRFLEKKDIFTVHAYIIGGIADLIVTSGLGIGFVYLLSFVGHRYLILKGIGYGLAVWVSIFGTLLGHTVQEKIPQSPSSIYVTIIAHFFFGLSLAILTKMLYKPNHR